MAKQQSFFDLDEVFAARDAGMARVANKAETSRPNFALDAQTFILHYLSDHGPTAGEIVNVECKRSGIQPHDDRAFGPVYMALVRAGRIKIVGHVKRFRGHGAPGGRVWSLT